MVKDDVLDKLYQARSDLNEQITELSSGGAKAKKQLPALSRRRDELEAAINTMIASAFPPSSACPELETVAKKLGEATDKLHCLERKIANVNACIAVGGQIIEIAKSIIKLIA